MVHPLYYVLDLIFAFILLGMLFNELHADHDKKKHEKAYMRLLLWVLFFCLQDAFWGFCASGVFESDTPLFISSAVFHISTVATTFFWLYYILTFMWDRIKMKRALLFIDGLVVLFQVVLVTLNFHTPTIYSVHNGAYVTEYLRPLAFFNQYVVYLVISIFTGIAALSIKGSRREKYLSVFLFSLAPVLSGIFQLLYPDGPFYAMGYFLGCFIINMYVVAKERTELFKIQSLRQMNEQRHISNTDALTGLLNRRSYEESRILTGPGDDNYTYISIDINGLKVVNDTMGHSAGDELIKGAAECLKRCLGAYGHIYRIGGDEFAAIIYATSDELKRIKKDLDETILRWRGDKVKEISMSYGIVTKREFTSISPSEIAKLADERMYAAKEEYYSRKGVDRKGLQSAYSALCASYTKILKINITEDVYRIIQMNTSEQTAEKGFADKISVWLHNFGTSGQVHPDDLENYLALTSKDYINKFFDEDKQNLNIFYRRKSSDGYRMTKMEMIPAEDYRRDDKNLYLYVKDIDE